MNDADLSGSQFNDANLSGASFNQTNFSGASFNDSNLSGWKVNDVNLSGTKIATIAPSKTAEFQSAVHAYEGPMSEIADRSKLGNGVILDEYAFDELRELSDFVRRAD